MSEENNCLDSEEIKEVCEEAESAMPCSDTAEEPCDAPEVNE
jgi:hypothetical protein